MMADAGVVPFSGTMLSGVIGSATTIMIGDAESKAANECSSALSALETDN